MEAAQATQRFEAEGLVDVLYVGSDSDLADMYRLKLELDGYRVRTLPTLRHWSGARPDLVILDLEPLDGTGLTELKRLRADRRLGQVPAILLVGESAHDLEARGVRLPPWEYLMHSRPSAVSGPWWQETAWPDHRAVAASGRSRPGFTDARPSPQRTVAIDAGFHLRRARPEGPACAGSAVAGRSPG